MKKPVYFNHDGGVDDLVSLFLLLQMEHLKVIGMSVIPADCYLEPALSASQKSLIDSALMKLKSLLQLLEASIHFRRSGACMLFM